MTTRDLLHARIMSEIEQARHDGYQAEEYAITPPQTPAEIADALLDGLMVVTHDALLVEIVRADEAEQCAQAIDTYSLTLDAEYADTYPEAIDALSDAMQIIRRRIPTEPRTT